MQHTGLSLIGGTIGSLDRTSSFRLGKLGQGYLSDTPDGASFIFPYFALLLGQCC